MILSRDASIRSQSQYLARENSEERIKSTLDRFTVKEDPSKLSTQNLLTKPTMMTITNQDILPFTVDFGNKAVWEATEGRNYHLAVQVSGGSHITEKRKLKYQNQHPAMPQKPKPPKKDKSVRVEEPPKKPTPNLPRKSKFGMPASNAATMLLQSHKYNDYSAAAAGDDLAQFK
jgi:hypothetical protein